MHQQMQIAKISLNTNYTNYTNISSLSHRETPNDSNNASIKDPTNIILLLQKQLNNLNTSKTKKFKQNILLFTATKKVQQNQLLLKSWNLCTNNPKKDIKSM